MSEHIVVLDADNPVSFHTIAEIIEYCTGEKHNAWMQALWPKRKNFESNFKIWFNKLAKTENGVKKSATFGCLNVLSEDGNILVFDDEKESDTGEGYYYGMMIMFSMAPGEDYLFRGVYLRDQINSALNHHVNTRIAKKVKLTVYEDSAYAEVLDSTVDDIIKNIEDDNNLSETEKVVLTKNRIGQGPFRDRLIERYDGKCQLCHFEKKELLRASHIKERANANNEERLDTNNGLLLCVLHDALFDKHFISFDDNGKIIISDSLNTKDRMLTNVNSSMEII